MFPTVGGGWRDVIYKGPDDIYYLEGSSDSGAPAAGGTFSGPMYGTSALPLNIWSHLAATYDGLSLRLYVNGVQVSSQAVFADQHLDGGADDRRRRALWAALRWPHRRGAHLQHRAERDPNPERHEYTDRLRPIARSQAVNTPRPRDRQRACAATAEPQELQC